MYVCVYIYIYRYVYVYVYVATVIRSPRRAGFFGYGYGKAMAIKKSLKPGSFFLGTGPSQGHGFPGRLCVCAGLRVKGLG